MSDRSAARRENRHNEGITIGKRLCEMCGRLFGNCPGFKERFCGATVCADSLARVHVREDSGANDRVDELERVLLAQKVGADERARRAEGGFWFQPC